MEDMEEAGCNREESGVRPILWNSCTCVGAQDAVALHTAYANRHCVHWHTGSPEENG